jgi:hypothetical protein
MKEITCTNLPELVDAVVEITKDGGEIESGMSRRFGSRYMIFQNNTSDVKEAVVEPEVDTPPVEDELPEEPPKEEVVEDVTTPPVEEDVITDVDEGVGDSTEEIVEEFQEPSSLVEEIMGMSKKELVSFIESNSEEEANLTMNKPTLQGIAKGII